MIFNDFRHHVTHQDIFCEIFRADDHIRFRRERLPDAGVAAAEHE